MYEEITHHSLMQRIINKNSCLGEGLLFVFCLFVCLFLNILSLSLNY